MFKNWPIFAYLLSAVAVNWLISTFGQTQYSTLAVAVGCFVFVAFDLTSRDYLHELWSHTGLWWKMGLLVLVGSLLSWALNGAGGPIAIASFMAFLAGGVTDTAVYSALINQKWGYKVNVSNAAGAVVDSLVFLLLAISAGVLPSFLFLTLFSVQVIAKIGGGLLWSRALRYR